MGHFGFTLVLLWVTWVSVWGHFRPLWGHFAHFETTLGSYRVPCELKVPKVLVFLRKNNKNGNLCYHGKGSEERAREAVRGQQKGMSMPEHCNVYDIGDRMQSKQ